MCCLLTYSIKYFLQSLPLFNIESHKHAAKIFVRTIEIISNLSTFNYGFFKNVCQSLRSENYLDLLKKITKKIQKRVKSSFPPNLFENSDINVFSDTQKTQNDNFFLYITKIISWTDFKTQTTMKFAFLNSITSIKQESYVYFLIIEL